MSNNRRRNYDTVRFEDNGRCDCDTVRFEDNDRCDCDRHDCNTGRCDCNDRAREGVRCALRDVITINEGCANIYSGLNNIRRNNSCDDIITIRKEYQEILDRADCIFEDVSHVCYNDNRKALDEIRKGLDDVKKGLDEVEKGLNDIRKGNVREGIREIRRGINDIELGVCEIEKGLRDIRFNNNSKDSLNINIRINKNCC